MRPLRPLIALSLAGFLIAACSAGPGAPGSPSAPAASASAEPSPQASGNEGGGAVGGNPGSGVTPVPIAPVGPGQSAPPMPSPSPSEVQPVAGLLNVHDVHASALQASVSNGHLIGKVFWWSGPPPCSQLAEVRVDRTGSTFTLTVREGAQQLGVACPALAMYKVTTVDLGAASPGTYTVNALGVEPGITVRYTG
ncbi:MAG: hypothetical protein ACYDAN_01625 [Candidatus Limnocylindrales bacterium]